MASKYFSDEQLAEIRRIEEDPNYQREMDERISQLISAHSECQDVLKDAMAPGNTFEESLEQIAIALGIPESAYEKMTAGQISALAVDFARHAQGIVQREAWIARIRAAHLATTVVGPTRRNDNPSENELRHGRKVLEGMSVRNPSKTAFRDAYRDAGHSASNAKAGLIFDAIRKTAE